MKKLLYLVAAVCCIALSSSCAKIIMSEYSYNIRSMEYMDGYKDEAEEFANACYSASNSLNGTYFTEDQYINAMGLVAFKYDKKHIKGLMKLYKDSSLIKFFNLTYGEEE